VPVLVAACLAYPLLRYGIDAWWVALAMFWCTMTAASQYIERMSASPRKTYFWVALASWCIAFVFIGMPLAAGTAGLVLVLALVGWAGVSLLALIWAVHFERTETLRATPPR
jgi:CDP-diglyceride synthetase